jgi:predicted amino acid racemase
MRRAAESLKVSVLPVMKGAFSYPAIISELIRGGFPRFGFAETDEPFAFGSPSPLPREDRVMIQLAPPSRVKEVVERYKTSFQSMPETLAALSGAAQSLGLSHEILLMVDLGDQREGQAPEDMSQLLDLALKLPGLETVGFGVSLACLGNKLPTRADLEKLESLAALFRERGLDRPVVSVGGSVFCNFMDQAPSGLITELRAGDPFLIGHDIYRDQPLAFGHFRSDICYLSAEVVEVKTIRGGTESPPDHNASRTRALCEMGRFHTSLNVASVNLERLACQEPGAAIVGLTAGYIAVDVTDCPRPVKVGQWLDFHPGYWAMAQAFRNPLTRVEIQGGTP